MKIKITILLVVAIQIIGWSQWEERNISTNATLSAVDFLNDQIGFVAGGNQIFKTENGGNDWTISFTANGLIVYEDVFIIDDTKIIGVGKNLDTNQSFISRTEDGGVSWTAIGISNTSFLQSVFFVNTNTGYISGDGGLILKTTDSGKNWQELDSGINAYLRSIYFVNELIGIAVGGSPNSSKILKTTDGGETWNLIPSPSNNYLQSVFFSSEEIAYVVGWNGEIMKTVDCGSSWITQNSVAMTGNLEITFTDEQTGYIVGGSINESLVQKTTDGGELWEDISPEISSGLISIDFPSFNIGYTVGTNGTVLRTASGGTTTGTKDVSFANGLTIFPNPTDGFFSIQSDGQQSIEQVKIWDSTGRLLKDLNPHLSNEAIDLSNLESNIYYIEIQSEGKRYLRKIVKK